MVVRGAIYTVIKVKGNIAVLEPVADAMQGVHKRGRLKVYTSFALSAGQRVRIGLSTRRQAVAGMLCLAVPLLCAVSGCALGAYIAHRMGQSFSASKAEWLKALCTMISCILGNITMAVIARRRILSSGHSDGTLQVVKVLI